MWKTLHLTALHMAELMTQVPEKEPVRYISTLKDNHLYTYLDKNNAKRCKNDPLHTHYTSTSAHSVYYHFRGISSVVGFVFLHTLVWFGWNTHGMWIVYYFIHLIVCLSSSVCRYRTGRGNSPNQLTVEEMRSFVRQLYNLPCSLTQAPLLKVTDTHMHAHTYSQLCRMQAIFLKINEGQFISKPLI